MQAGPHSIEWLRGYSPTWGEFFDAWELRHQPRPRQAVEHWDLRVQTLSNLRLTSRLKDQGWYGVELLTKVEIGIDIKNGLGCISCGGVQAPPTNDRPTLVARLTAAIAAFSAGGVGGWTRNTLIVDSYIERVLQVGVDATSDEALDAIFFVTGLPMPSHEPDFTPRAPGDGQIQWDDIARLGGFEGLGIERAEDSDGPTANA